MLHEYTHDKPMLLAVTSRVELSLAKLVDLGPSFNQVLIPVYFMLA